jgi:hypothetical protein
MDMEENDEKWTPEPKCSCTGKGKPVLFDGQMVRFLSPSCRVHKSTFTSTNNPQSAETIVGNWKEKEK